ncbi:MAG: RibD family protein [Limnochordia bacterium]|jgi:2,5-diamino-6-(ribosylamino)-4(3H)-pyrimidinone 5'-phosphate reductase
MSRHFYSDLQFELPETRPLVACNMVMSLDGKVTSGGALQPGSIGSAFDLQTMQVIRSHFDAVLSGGNTVRQHPYYLGVSAELEHARKERGLASQPLSVVLTRSGSLNPGTPLFKNPPRPPIVLTGAAGAASLAPEIKAKAAVDIMEELSPSSICQLLFQKYGVRRLLVEGGPSVNYQFMQAQLLDELFLTLAPTLVGLRTDLTLAMGSEVLAKPREAELVSLNQHGQELFLRYRFRWSL